MTQESKEMVRAIVTLRESAKSLRHSGWNNTAKECESVADELEGLIES